MGPLLELRSGYKVNKKHSCGNHHIFAGFLLGTGAVGPAFGFILGGICLNIYIDIGTVDIKK